VKELSGHALETASSDLVAFIEGVETVRIYINLDEMPFVLLDALYTHLQDSTDLKEVNICIQTLLLPALQDLQENFGLERALTATIRRCTAKRTALRFLFLRLGVATSCEKFDGFQEVDLFTAIKDLAKGSVELTEILAQTERGAPSIQTSASTLNDDKVVESGMDLDEYV
jgi:hypothetical protein